MSTTVRADSTDDVSIPAGSKLTVVVAAGGSAVASRNAGGGAELDRVTLAPGETRVFGPYLVGMHVKLTCVLGSLAYTLSQVTDSSAADVTDGPAGVGAVEATLAAAGTVDVAEWGTDAVRKTELTLDALPVTLTDDAGVGAWLAKELYDFPAGNILFHGAVIDADITLNETWWANAAAGDVSLGTAANTDGTTLDSTLQNVIPTTAIAGLTAQVGPIDAASTATEGGTVIAAAGTTDAKLYLNLRIDEDGAHFPDVVTNGAFTTDASWVKGTGWTVDSGNSNKGACDASQTAVSDLAQAGAVLVPGVTYEVKFTTDTVTGGKVRAVINGTLGTERSTDATFTQNIVAGASGGVALRADADFAGNVDDFSATPLTGTGVITGKVTIVWADLGDY